MGCLRLNIENSASLKVLNGGKSELRKKCLDTSRYAYNGMEKDPEIKGEGNSYTTEFRQYDPRLGRWLSLDPLMMQFPDMSPYVAFDNNPIFFIDPYGLSSEGGNECDDGKSTGNNETFIGDDGKEYTSSCEAVPIVGKTQKSLAIEHVNNMNNGYIRQWEDLSDPEKNLLIKGAFKASVNPIDIKAKVRTDDMPLFVVGGGFGTKSLLDEFNNGTGPEQSVFFIGHQATQDLKNKNEEIKRLRQEVFNKFGGSEEKMIEYAQQHSGKVYTKFKSHSGTMLPWEEGMNSSQFIGTFSADIFYDNNTGNLIFVVSDSKSKSSKWYHLASNIKRNKKERTPEGNTYQKYIWTEHSSKLSDYE
jgi:RHS repeat-associated protein